MGKSSSDPAPAPHPLPVDPITAKVVDAPAVEPISGAVMQPKPTPQVIQPAPGTRFAPDENSGKPEPATTGRRRKSKGKQKTGKGLLGEPASDSDIGTSTPGDTAYSGS